MSISVQTWLTIIRYFCEISATLITENLFAKRIYQICYPDENQVPNRKADEGVLLYMDEIDAQGRQMLIDRPALTRGRLSVFRESDSDDHWFPRLNVNLKKAGSDQILWQWTTHDSPIDFGEPPPYGEDLMLEKYFELEEPVKSPRGIEVVFHLGPGATKHGRVSQFSASLYLYPTSFEDRGVQIGVIDFRQGLTTGGVPLFARYNFPW